MYQQRSLGKLKYFVSDVNNHNPEVKQLVLTGLHMRTAHQIGTASLILGYLHNKTVQDLVRGNE